MAILTEADRAAYFPSVELPAGDALDFLLRRAQSEAEAIAGRALEPKERTDTVSVLHGGCRLPFAPILSILAVEYLNSGQQLECEGRGWQITGATVDIPCRLPGEMARVRYVTGWDFAAPDLTWEAQSLKSAVGVIAEAIHETDANGTDAPITAMGVTGEYSTSYAAPSPMASRRAAAHMTIRQIARAKFAASMVR